MGNIQDYIYHTTEIFSAAANDNLISDQDYLDFLQAVIKEAQGRYDATKSDMEPDNN